jgi:hypothetical protein
VASHRYDKVLKLATRFTNELLPNPDHSASSAGLDDLGDLHLQHLVWSPPDQAARHAPLGASALGYAP